MDLRKHNRITAEPKCTARLKVGGQSYANIAVSNLGADGCCLEIPSESAKGIKNFAMLEGVELRHTGLPKQAVAAKVVWMHRKKGAEKDYMETGIQFCGAPEQYGAEVDRYVAALLDGHPRTSM